ncbi:DUF6646 domain-containing protein [Flavobacterium antarcticum]|uniref:DUF6646 family protein n=1 Tax=Flavobacterium antarcticum TaxID=271155 RepID=UPI0003B2FED2|nr:DUF6646 family protein [Flavobacterium antarcticum]
MKKILLLLAVFATVQISNAQAFQGKGDTKFQVGLNLQNGGTGITSTVDFGLGENMSFGFVATYLLDAKDIDTRSASFEDRADAKVRFNANIGNVLGLSPKMDLYPGLNLGTRNFGAHLGFRYFFTDGFGLYAETFAPLARYDSQVRGFEHYNNQFVVHFGASFNL